MKRPRTLRRLSVLPDGTRLRIDGGKLELVKRNGKWLLKKRKASNEES